jgi:hypothetical protein
MEDVVYVLLLWLEKFLDDWILVESVIYKFKLLRAQGILIWIGK